MAKPIPPRLYQEIEWNLHHVQLHQQTVREEFDSIFAAKAMVGQFPARGHGHHGDPTATRAIRLADGTRESNNSSAWLKAIGETQCFFAGAPEAELFESYYGCDITMEALSEQTGISVKTYQNRRDNVVFRCAMHAAGLGLIRLEA